MIKKPVLLEPIYGIKFWKSSELKTIETMKYTYWENTSNGHQKFWAATIKEEKRDIRVGSGVKEKNFFVLVRKWGKIGTAGQSMEQLFNNRYEADQMLQSLIYEKEHKGYKPVF